MTIRELAPVAPLVIFALLIYAGADPTGAALIPFLLCEAAGVLVYVLEIRDRFKHRGGRR